MLRAQKHAVVDPATPFWWTQWQPSRRTWTSFRFFWVIRLLIIRLIGRAHCAHLRSAWLPNANIPVAQLFATYLMKDINASAAVVQPRAQQLFQYLHTVGWYLDKGSHVKRHVQWTLAMRIQFSVLPPTQRWTMFYKPLGMAPHASYMEQERVPRIPPTVSAFLHMQAWHVLHLTQWSSEHVAVRQVGVMSQLASTTTFHLTSSSTTTTNTTRTGTLQEPPRQELQLLQELQLSEHLTSWLWTNQQIIHALVSGQRKRLLFVSSVSSGASGTIFSRFNVLIVIIFW